MLQSYIPTSLEKVIFYLSLFFFVEKKIVENQIKYLILIQAFYVFGNSATEAPSRTTEIERVLLAGGDGDTWPGCCSTAAAAAKGTVCSAL